MIKLKQWLNHKGIVLDSVNGSDVIECRKCGFRHIVPIPILDEMQPVYRNDFYKKEKPLYLKRYREDLDWWNLVYDERYDIFEKHLPKARRRLLDIGSGPGFFLLRGKERGWSVLGIEPSKQAARHSRSLGVDIIEDFLTNDSVTKIGKFDVVCLSEVLEHIPDPEGMLRIARELLTGNGLICVVVPNDYSPIQIALKKYCGFKPWWVGPPFHINYFNFDSLHRLLEKCGFDIILREATFPIDMFLLMGVNYIGNDKLGRQCHAKRKILEKNLNKAGLSEQKRILYQEFASLGIGREAMIIGEK